MQWLSTQIAENGLVTWHRSAVFRLGPTGFMARLRPSQTYSCTAMASCSASAASALSTVLAVAEALTFSPGSQILRLQARRVRIEDLEVLQKGADCKRLHRPLPVLQADSRGAGACGGRHSTGTRLGSANRKPVQARQPAICIFRCRGSWSRVI